MFLHVDNDMLTASCGELCRAVSRHDIVRRHDTTWGVSCGVSCHEGKFTDGDRDRN